MSDIICTHTGSSRCITHINNGVLCVDNHHFFQLDRGGSQLDVTNRNTRCLYGKLRTRIRVITYTRCLDLILTNREGFNRKITIHVCLRTLDLFSVLLSNDVGKRHRLFCLRIDNGTFDSTLS